MSAIHKSAALFSIALILAMPSITLGQQARPPQPVQNDFTFNVNVHEVLLHATVRNKKGAPVAGLTQQDFQVFEDHVLQPIKHFSHEDIPVTAGIIIDNSGSMQPRRAEVIAASLAFASSSNPHDQMFLVNFNEHVRFGLPPGTAFTDQQSQLDAAMKTVIADGKTALYDAVIVALQHLSLGNRDKKVLIVVSDGADNASSHSKEQMLALATQSEAIIYAIGIYEEDDPDKNPHVLKELVKAGGGEAYFPKQLKEVVPICERIAHEIRNQYTISYTPTNQTQDGTYRTIQVRAQAPGGPGLAVTTRVGYVAPTTKPSATVSDSHKPEGRN
jgi:VWFA-related protein